MIAALTLSFPIEANNSFWMKRFSKVLRNPNSKPNPKSYEKWYRKVQKFYKREKRLEPKVGNSQQSWDIYYEDYKTEEDVINKFEALAPRWFHDLLNPHIHGAVLAKLATIIDAYRPVKVVDVGCGLGLDSCFLALSFPNITFIGSDFSQTMIEHAHARKTRLKLNNCEFLVSSHQNLPNVLSPNSVDFIICNGATYPKDSVTLEDDFKAFNLILKLRGHFMIALNHHQNVDNVLELQGFNIVNYMPMNDSNGNLMMYLVLTDKMGNIF